MRRGIWYIFGIVVFVAIVFGLGEVSLQSSSCMSCHSEQGKYAHWMGQKLKVEKKGFSHELIACAHCHILGSPQGTIASRFRGLGHVAQYLVPQIDPRKSQSTNFFTRTRIPSQNCEHCHLGAIQRKAVMVKDLPENIKTIGLAMDHRKHVYARNDQCSKCHERYKDDQLSADKSVAFTEVNHMACDSCHTLAAHAYKREHFLPMSNAQFISAQENAWNWLERNPRWMIAIPAEASCRRCHNGKIHYKTKIFEADCKNGQDYQTCVKCHPLMTKDWFENYRKQRSLVRNDQEGPIEPGLQISPEGLSYNSDLSVSAHSTN